MMMIVSFDLMSDCYHCIIQEGVSIDPYERAVRVYTRDAHNNITWQEFANPNPAQLPSQVLPGFVLDLSDVL